MPNVVSRFARSWQLIQASCDVLRADNALLILPALSGLAATALAAGFAALAISDGTFKAIRESGSLNAFGPLYAWVFCWYVAQYFVVIFFNTAPVGAAIALLNGGRPTLGAAPKLALSRIGAILGYAVISATAGVLLQALAERLGLIGRLIEATLGLAWTAATFLVVPILAAEGIGALAGDRAQHRAVAQDLGRKLDRQCRYFAGDVNDIRHGRPNRSRRRHVAISARPPVTWRRAALRVDHNGLADSLGCRRAVGDPCRGRLPLRLRRRPDPRRLHAQGHIIGACGHQKRKRLG
jgi:uncharacterized protein DUF6159